MTSPKTRTEKKRHEVRSEQGGIEWKKSSERARLFQLRFSPLFALSSFGYRLMEGNCAGQVNSIVFIYPSIHNGQMQDFLCPWPHLIILYPTYTALGGVFFVDSPLSVSAAWTHQRVWLFLAIVYSGKLSTQLSTWYYLIIIIF